METTTKTTANTVLTPAQLLAHWQGHRGLTRRVIEAFPENELFSYSIGGMRPFAAMVEELLGIAAPGIQEIVEKKTVELKEKLNHENSKEKLLAFWDDTTAKINAYWSTMDNVDYNRVYLSFGTYEGTVQSAIFYFIDNEIHHRAQAYVYLRSLGIEPPHFYER
ncbi:DinB family protein [Croceivirga sp. JEA036]|uniref:DinB family protein n=1 Tax=Croceivirga sp. JEA036 TaxID=2721162 RepID=UPI00143ACBAC|nr:DinB family protein [Croceivirga sp. JEA036]NJB38155.1 damage-inducible protein DinB [Croceivirga sp. JEA036]